MSQPKRQPNPNLPPYRTLHYDIINAGGMQLERHVYVNAGGNFQQQIEVTRGNVIKDAVSWAIDAKESHDNLLAVVNHHWEHMKRGFELIGDLGSEYYALKSKKPEMQEAFGDALFDGMRRRLTVQPMNDKSWQDGIINDSFYPIYRPSDVLERARNMAQHENSKYGIKLDAIEHKLRGILKKGHQAENLFYNYTYLKEEDYEHYEPDHQHDDEGAYLEHQFKGKGGGTIEPWMDPDFDVDEARENRLDKKMREMRTEIVEFCDVANDVWMKAARAVSKSEPFRATNDDIRLMRVKMNRVRSLYDAITEESSIGGKVLYEQQAFHQMMQKDLLPELQCVLAIMQRPQVVKDIISKCLPSGRQRDS